VKHLEFTVPAGPNTGWKIRVFVWPDKNAYLRARKRVGGDTSGSVAFCFIRSRPDTLKDGECVANVHFNRKNLKLSYIVHECYHALGSYANFIKLKENTVSGEEWAADSIEHMVDGIVFALKKKRVAIK
jgi:hypothetical protein